MKKILFWAGCILLVIAAGAAGFFVTARELDKPEAGIGITPADNSPGDGGIPAMTVVELLYVYDTETGSIDDLYIEVLNCAKEKITFIRIPVEVLYTMSNTLFAGLSTENVRLPQIVTLSRLYRYYDTDAAFYAGSRIISEMLNYSFNYYSAIPKEDFMMFFSIEEDGDEQVFTQVITEEEAKGDSFSTAGSVKGTLSRWTKNMVTNLSLEERLRYLDVYDSLVNIDYTELPVIASNESRSLDETASSKILYNILY